MLLLPTVMVEVSACSLDAFPPGYCELDRKGILQEPKDVLNTFRSVNA